jgi:DNA-binding MarR family transcriptional regulator
MENIGVQNNITYLCSRFAHGFTLALTKAFQQHNIAITAEQFSILVVLWEKDGVSQNEISRALDRDKTTITRVLVHLRSSNYITQEVDENDNRSKRVCLTKKGKVLQAKALEVAGNLYTQIVQDLSQAQLQQGIDILQKMNNNLKS